MEASQFLQAYPRQLSDRQIDATVDGVDLCTSRMWSDRFGRALYSHLTGTERTDGLTARGIEGYAYWNRDVLPRLVTLADKSAGDENSKGAINELNFHALNLNMYVVWQSILFPNMDMTAADRKFTLTVAQDALAIQGLKYYLNREQTAGKAGEYRYFEKANLARRNSFEGRVAEFDLGLVCLELMLRDEDLTIVPAPIQFESFSKRSKDNGFKNANVDFIAMKNGNVTGLQLKTRISEEDIEGYDPDRVILIDAHVDLGNSRFMRMQQESSRHAVVSWGGLLCTQRVHGINTRGKSAVIYNSNPRQVSTLKMRARTMVAGMHPYLDMATNNVKARLEPALAA